MSRTNPPTPEGLAHLHADGITGPFWEAAAEHRLVCQRCEDCGTSRLPPVSHCAVCRSARYAWDELPGTGTVYTYTIVHHAFAPFLKDHVPYTVALVELDGAPGVRLVADVVEPDPEQVRIGDRVRIVWDDADDGVTIPKAQRETPA